VKAPFSVACVYSSTGLSKYEWRVADANDDRVATCWDKENADEIARRLNEHARFINAYVRATMGLEGQAVPEGNRDKT
jgi:hypothetical protein